MTIFSNLYILTSSGKLYFINNKYGFDKVLLINKDFIFINKDEFNDLKDVNIEGRKLYYILNKGC